jgi:hypothetical protein
VLTRPCFQNIKVIFPLATNTNDILESSHPQQIVPDQISIIKKKKKEQSKIKVKVEGRRRSDSGRTEANPKRGRCYCIRRSRMNMRCVRAKVRVKLGISVPWGQLKNHSSSIRAAGVMVPCFVRTFRSAVESCLCRATVGAGPGRGGGGRSREAALALHAQRVRVLVATVPGALALAQP